MSEPPLACRKGQHRAEHPHLNARDWFANQASVQREDARDSWGAHAMSVTTWRQLDGIA
jgi:hypothetical protein